MLEFIAYYVSCVIFDLSIQLKTAAPTIVHSRSVVAEVDSGINFANSLRVCGGKR